MRDALAVSSSAIFIVGWAVAAVAIYLGIFLKKRVLRVCGCGAGVGVGGYGGCGWMMDVIVACMDIICHYDNHNICVCVCVYVVCVCVVCECGVCACVCACSSTRRAGGAGRRRLVGSARVGRLGLSILRTLSCISSDESTFSLLVAASRRNPPLPLVRYSVYLLYCYKSTNTDAPYGLIPTPAPTRTGLRKACLCQHLRVCFPGPLSRLSPAASCREVWVCGCVCVCGGVGCVCVCVWWPPQQQHQHKHNSSVVL